jgi:hypothetical protein
MAEIDQSGEPFEFKGHTYVALAPVVRGWGGEVAWDNVTKRATILLDGRTVRVQMANEEVETEDGTQTLDAPPLVVDETLIVPRTFFGDILNRPLQ